MRRSTSFILVALPVGTLIGYAAGSRHAMQPIPIIEDPPFVTAREATFLKDKELVLGIVVNGQAKAYPIRILGRYEILNDHVGRRSVFATW